MISHDPTDRPVLPAGAADNPLQLALRDELRKIGVRRRATCASSSTPSSGRNRHPRSLPRWPPLASMCCGPQALPSSARYSKSQGRYRTGISILATELDGKRQELLSELVPAMRHIAALADPRVIVADHLLSLQAPRAKREQLFQFTRSRRRK